MKKFFLIFYTILALRPIQIRYQLWYRLRKIWRKATNFRYPLSIERQTTSVILHPWIEKPVSLVINSETQSRAGGANLTFTFLNLSKRQEASNINWNETEYGKLWAYNLNYMDYLLQSNLDKETGLQLINNFIQKLSQNPTGLEPYCIALRGINWIKFLSSPLITAELDELKLPNQSFNIVQINSSLYAQYKILFDTPEWHILANHLLEDGFSLLFGAVYFNDSTFYNKAKLIIETELNEQILEDGAHFELSPMYHQIILDRLLDCINLLKNNKRFEDQKKFMNLMQGKAQKMLTWLNTITFSNGQTPLLNDAAPGIAPTNQQLNKYAASLDLQYGAWNLELSSSGYRKFAASTYECIIDIGQIGPSYQPGHAHADTFNFVLNVKNESVIVDTGISTYDTGETRLKERGTAAHNTISVQDKNSSEVWSSFRVARHAKVKVLKDEGNTVIAQHDGYKRIGTIHQRKWNFSNDSIDITDMLSGKIILGKAHFWLAPTIAPHINKNKIETPLGTFSFENATSVDLIPTEIPNGFNSYSKTHKIEITFKNHLKTIITQI